MVALAAKIVTGIGICGVLSVFLVVTIIMIVEDETWGGHRSFSDLNEHEKEEGLTTLKTILPHLR